MPLFYLSVFLFVSESVLGLCSLHRRACCGCRFQRRVVPTEPEILAEVMKLLCRAYDSLSISFFELELARHPCLSAAKDWIELNPRHIGFGDKRGVAASTFGHRFFRGGLIVGQWMMPEGEEAPAVRLSKTLGVFHR